MRRISRRHSTKWYIMCARDWISGKPSIEKIIQENNSKGTILVVSRDGIKTFILGSQGNYGEINSIVSYTQDTGNGYGKQGECKIENIIQINENKVINSGNGIGLDEKRTLWVFK